MFFNKERGVYRVVRKGKKRGFLGVSVFGLKECSSVSMSMLSLFDFIRYPSPMFSIVYSLGLCYDILMPFLNDCTFLRILYILLLVFLMSSSCLLLVPPLQYYIRNK